MTCLSVTKLDPVGFPKTTSCLRILVVDDHGIVREGLAALLERDDSIRIVGFATTGEEAVLAAQRLRPDVIIMDLVLPDLNGIDATQRILRDVPGTRILALSACHSAHHVHRALRAGALGYVLKSAVGAELLCAVKAVSAGMQYISAAISASFPGGAVRLPLPASPFESLSTREHEVLRCIVAGSTSVEIAHHLSLSRKTVDTYRGRIMVKLGVPNRSALIHLAQQYDLPVV
jgi:two-component system, NarL family, invasion response regulator UvrY